MRGIAAIWLRNFVYFRRNVFVTFFWTAFEPILYLFAIGFSLGKAVGSYQGVSYVQFYVPALLTTTAMMIGYFESTFGSFSKMEYQKTYATIFLAPISAHEIVFGEILWCASKGIFGFTCVALVASAFGVMPRENLIPTFLLLFLVSLMFSAFGMLMSSFAKNYEFFTFSISGFIIPMSLFGGTYFPLEELPVWLQHVAWCFPLTHAVNAVRGLTLNRENDMI
jgi:lipooligosaccharide transport system permease protein